MSTGENASYRVIAELVTANHKAVAIPKTIA